MITFKKEHLISVISLSLVGFLLSACFTLQQAPPVGPVIEEWEARINNHHSRPHLSVVASDKKFKVYLGLRPSDNNSDCEKVKYGPISGEVKLHSVDGTSKKLPFTNTIPRDKETAFSVRRHTIAVYMGRGHYGIGKFLYCQGAFEYEPVYFPHEIKEITFSIKGNLIFEDTIIPLDGSGVMEEGEWKDLWNKKL